MKGPAIFLGQFLSDEPPFNRLDSIARWAASLRYKGVQIPTWDTRVFDLDTAAESKVYCDDLRGKLQSAGIVPTELAAHLQGQVLALHPVYEELFQVFYPQGLRGAERTAWAADQLRKAVRASANMGTDNIPVLSGGFAWHLCYPWPQRPAGLVEEAFRGLTRLWHPLLDLAQENGIVFTYELHPGSDLYDGATYERFLDVVEGHPSACLNYDPSHFLLQQLDYLDFIRLYGDRIRAFHVKDAEFHPSGRMGVYSGYQSWARRAGRFRSLGDGQVDFTQVFSLLTEAGFDGWAVLEWECCLKSPEQGAREGAEFITKHLIEATSVAFDDFSKAESDMHRNRRILGLED